MAVQEPTNVLQTLTTTNAAALAAISAALVAAVAGDATLGALQGHVNTQITALDAQVLALTTVQGVLDDYPLEPRPPTPVAFATRDRETRIRQRV